MSKLKMPGVGILLVIAFDVAVLLLYMLRTCPCFLGLTTTFLMLLALVWLTLVWVYWHAVGQEGRDEVGEMRIREGFVSPGGLLFSGDEELPPLYTRVWLLWKMADEAKEDGDDRQDA